MKSWRRRAGQAGSTAEPDEESLRKVRFRGKEYIFIYVSAARTCCCQPGLSGKGTMRIAEVDKKGNHFIEMIARTGQSGNGFIEYYFPKAGETEPLAKIAFVRGFPAGTGLSVPEALRR